MFCLVLRIANPDWMLIVQDDGWMLLNLLFAIPSFILMSPLMLLPFSGVTIHDYPFWMAETLEDRQPEACPRGASGILQLKPRYSERSVAAGSTRSARRIGRSVAAMAVTRDSDANGDATSGRTTRARVDYDWVVDLDVRGFFDNIDWELMMKAVKKHAQEPWVVLYIERWLTVPSQEADGPVVGRTAGTPQGGVVSPLLANLFLHYAFDVWMARQYPHLPFERYADDAIVHCRTKREAEEVREAIAARLTDCRLELHPEKTQIVYCKDDNRRGNYPIEKFDFLGYTFRPRRSKNHRGKYFISFTPAVSNKAARAIRAKIRSWHLPVRSDKSIEDLSRMFNPIVRGWLQYYGQYYRSAMYPSMRHLDRALTRWASRKYKKLRRHRRRAAHWIARISRRDPRLFAHWRMGVRRGSMVGAV